MTMSTHYRPPGQEPTNSDRAEWAEAALQTFMQQTRCDDDTAIADLLCDLMHYCDEQGIKFNAELKIARSNYREEK